MIAAGCWPWTGGGAGRSRLVAIPWSVGLDPAAVAVPLAGRVHRAVAATEIPRLGGPGAAAAESSRSTRLLAGQGGGVVHLTVPLAVLRGHGRGPTDEAVSEGRGHLRDAAHPGAALGPNRVRPSAAVGREGRIASRTTGSRARQGRRTTDRGSGRTNSSDLQRRGQRRPLAVVAADAELDDGQPSRRPTRDDQPTPTDDAAARRLPQRQIPELGGQ